MSPLPSLQIEESQWSVSQREEKLGQLVEQEKTLEQAFLTAVGDNNKFKEFLLKVTYTPYLQYFAGNLRTKL